MNEIPSLQENASVWKFKATLLWALLVGVVFYIVQMASIFLYIKFNHISIPGTDAAGFFEKLATDGNVLSYCTFATSILCSLLIFGIIKLKKGATIKHYLCVNHVSQKVYMQWIAYLVILVFVSDAVTLFLGRSLVPEVMVDIYDSSHPKILIWLTFLIAAPVFEEIFFRGFILTGLSSSFVGSSGAIVISAAAWSLIHFQYDLYGIATIFLIGIFLGIARVKSESIILTICLHALANLFSSIETIFVLANR